MSNFPDQPPEHSHNIHGTVPDVRAAIGFQLKAAAALVGNNRVCEFFEDLIGDIVRKRFPIDAGGLINAKCQIDVANEINKLLS